MRILKEVLSLTLLSLLGIRSRLASSLVIVTGMTGVVAVLLSMLAMSKGLLVAVEGTGHIGRAIVMRENSDSESSSALSRDAAAVILTNPGVKRRPNNSPIGSAEALGVLTLSNSENRREEVVVRGVGPSFRQLRPEIRLIAGRIFEHGKRELIVGQGAYLRFRGLEIGQQVRLNNTSWEVVGIYSSEGNMFESELMSDVETLLSAYNRNYFQSVTVQLASNDSFSEFKDSLTTNGTLAVDVKTESDYYRQKSQQLTVLMYAISYVVGAMAVGAIFGALNTMNIAIESRGVEVATLRALGFNSTSIIVSIVAEATLLAAIGAAIGIALAFILVNGEVVSTRDTAAQLIIRIKLDGELISVGMSVACVSGLIGGSIPAVRSLQIPIAQALRGT